MSVLFSFVFPCRYLSFLAQDEMLVQVDGITDRGRESKVFVVQGSQKNSVQAWGPSNRQPVSTWTHQSKNVWKAKEIDQKIPKEKMKNSTILQTVGRVSFRRRPENKLSNKRET